MRPPPRTPRRSPRRRSPAARAAPVPGPPLHRRARDAVAGGERASWGPIRPSRLDGSAKRLQPLGAEPGDFLELVHRPEAAVRLAVLDDPPRQAGPHPVELLELRLRGVRE